MLELVLLTLAGLSALASLLWGLYILGQGAILFAVLGRFGEVWGLS